MVNCKCYEKYCSKCNKKFYSTQKWYNDVITPVFVEYRYALHEIIKHRRKKIELVRVSFFLAIGLLLQLLSIVTYPFRLL